MDARRRLLATVSVVALSATLLLLGDARPALAKADCLQTNPSADVAVSQTITSILLNDGLGSPGLLKQVTLTNGGPCNVPDVTLIDTLPSGSSVFGAITTNPSGWNCYIGDPAPGQVRCVPTNTMGVPGTATISIMLTMPTGSDWRDTAQVFVGGSTTDFLAGCNDPGGAATTCDDKTANNTSWGALLAAGSSLSACNDGTDGDCQQSIEVSVGTNGKSGSTQIQNLTNGPNQCAGITGFTNCFGTLVWVTSSISDATKLLIVNATYAHGSYGGVSAIYSADGITWSKVTACNKAKSNTPCLVSKSKFKIGTATYYQFEVYTGDIDDGWGFDG